MSASQPRPDKFWATAPGKVILSGEHAVVYGQAALAAAINLSSTAYLSLTPTKAQEPTISLALANTGWYYEATPAELKQLAADVQQRHHGFLHGSLPLENIFTSPAQLLPAAVGYCLQHHDLNIQANVHIELSTQLLLGGGMGSSASLVAAMLASLLHACGQMFTQQALYQQVLATEQWQHGRSSGLDPQVCIFGGLQVYQAGVCEQLSVAPLDDVYLVSTGRPQSTTGECVEVVRQQAHGEAFWQQFGELTQQLRQAVRQADSKAMLCLIRNNHGLLQQLKVVPEQVTEFINQAQDLGGAGKICGAGSLQGNEGGLVLLAGLRQQDASKLCADHGYDHWPLIWQTQGIEYGAV